MGAGLSPVSAQTTRAGNRWGVGGGNLIRFIANFVIPVDIVATTAGDVAGSQFGMSTRTDGANLEVPACIYSSPTNAWLLHSINAWAPNSKGAPGIGNTRYSLNLFTPLDYNPVPNNLSAIFAPVLITSELEQQGSVRSQGGTNPIANPLGLGFTMSKWRWEPDQQGHGSTQGLYTNAGYVDQKGNGEIFGVSKGVDRTFSPPLRIPARRVLCCQLTSPDTNAFNVLFAGVQALETAILYSEIPNPRGVV